jgi:hypothetical protein
MVTRERDWPSEVCSMALMGQEVVGMMNPPKPDCMSARHDCEASVMTIFSCQTAKEGLCGRGDGEREAEAHGQRVTCLMDCSAALDMWSLLMSVAARKEKEAV